MLPKSSFTIVGDSGVIRTVIALKNIYEVLIHEIKGGASGFDSAQPD